MILRDDLDQMFSHNAPTMSIIVQAEYTDELLKVVVEDRVVHSRIDVVKIRRDD